MVIICIVRTSPFLEGGGGIDFTKNLKKGRMFLWLNSGEILRREWFLWKMGDAVSLGIFLAGVW